MAGQGIRTQSAVTASALCPTQLMLLTLAMGLLEVAAIYQYQAAVSCTMAHFTRLPRGMTNPAENFLASEG
jgi:hypothetical protein